MKSERNRCPRCRATRNMIATPQTTGRGPRGEEWVCERGCHFFTTTEARILWVPNVQRPQLAEMGLLTDQASAPDSADIRRPGQRQMAAGFDSPARQ